MAEFWPSWWPFIPRPGERGDRVWRDPEGNPVDLREYLDRLLRPPPAATPPPSIDEPELVEPPPPPSSSSEPPPSSAPVYGPLPTWPPPVERTADRRFRAPTRARALDAFRSLPREAERTQPRYGQRFPALPGAFAPTEGVRIRPHDLGSRSFATADLLAWQRPRIEPTRPRRSPRRGPRVKPGRDPFVWPRRRRKADEPLRRPVPRRSTPPPIRKLPAPGVPDWTSPYPEIKTPPPVKLPRPTTQPLPPPLKIPAPTTPPPSSPVPPARPDIRLPQPGVPLPVPTSPQKRPQPARRAMPRPMPRPARLPAPGFPVPLPRSPSTQPRRFLWPDVTPSPLLPQPSPAPAPSPAPSTPAPTPLTPLNVDPLQFAQNPQPQPARERDRCEEARERRRRPSSIVAKVKAYGRRMSQNSLDNLRRG